MIYQQRLDSAKLQGEWGGKTREREGKGEKGRGKRRIETDYRKEEKGRGKEGKRLYRKDADDGRPRTFIQREHNIMSYYYYYA